MGSFQIRLNPFLTREISDGKLANLKQTAFNLASSLIDDNGVIVDISYSQGGLIAESAAKRLHPEVRDKIIAFGVGTVIYDRKTFKESTTYLNSCDGVAFLINCTQPYRYFSARMGNVENVSFIKGRYPFISHAYDAHYNMADRKIFNK